VEQEVKTVERQDLAQWKCHYRLNKYHEDIEPYRGMEHLFHEKFKPYEIVEGEGNCLLNTGIDEIWDLVTGAVAQASHIFDNASAKIGVGDSSTAAAATQTDLQAATNKTYKGQETGYPTSTTQKVTFKSSFGVDDANYAWAEWVVKSVDATTPTNICLNRKVESLGTKSGGTWTLEISLTLS